MATESLTIQIQGDTSGLAESLDQALSQIESLRNSAEGAGTAAEQIGSRLAESSATVGSIELISQALAAVGEQAAALAQQPITLNVEPALASLQSVLALIQEVSAQLRGMSAGGGGGQLLGEAGSSVTGPRNGFGELIFSAPQTATWATNLPPESTSTTSSLSFSQSASLQSLSDFQRHDYQAIEKQLVTRELQPIIPNQISERNSADDSPGVAQIAPLPASPHPNDQALTSLSDRARDIHNSPVTNHFGGITIAVRETADVNALMRDLRLQGLSIRHRHG